MIPIHVLPKLPFQVHDALGDQKLFGLVNNAGTGYGHNVTDKDIINTNFFGPKRVCDNFMSLVDPKAGRIINVGSNGGPLFVSTITDLTVKKQGYSRNRASGALFHAYHGQHNHFCNSNIEVYFLKHQMCSASTSWAELEVLMERFLDGDDFGGGTCYNLSKAGLMVYTMQLAAQYPNIKVRNEAENGTLFTAHILFNPLMPPGILCQSRIHQDKHVKGFWCHKIA